MNRIKGLRSFACAALVAVMASPAAALLRVDDVTSSDNLNLPSISSTGNEDFGNSQLSTSDKVYNYTSLNVLLEIATGKVTNLSGRLHVSTDHGINIPDLDDDVYRVSTSDVYTVGPKRGTNAAAASWLLVHNPFRIPTPNVPTFQ